MRKFLIPALCFVFTASVALAQMKVQPQAPAPAKKTPLNSPGMRTVNPTQFARISHDDAWKLYQEDKAVFIDVRSNSQFQLGHIKGALSIPGSQLIKRFSEVPPMKTVITYCACNAEQSSGRAAANLTAHGVTNVFALKGGWDEWKDKGRPTATGPK
jgi:rhodanese-related sulfurtransferase